jgi:hypothetical protein
LKLPLLLTQFLYQNKKLNLPGIGTFTLDPSTVIPEDIEKNPHEIVQGVEYRNAPVLKADDDLIEFIKLHTGKMKSLAEADLESYLTLGIQLLNIGKPFYFDGIGAIIKNQEGKYEFTPGEYISLKKDEPENEKKEKADKRKSVFDEKHDDYQPQTNSLRKFLVAAGIIGGLALIGWGGYTLYKRNTYQENTNIVTPVTPDTIAAKTDTSSNNTITSAPPKTDSVQLKTPENTVNNTVSGDSAKYKYIILATQNKYRALKRYNQLLSFDLKIKMETKDSSFFKLYFTFPARIKDTLHIKDSLNSEYGTKTIIER